MQEDNLIIDGGMKIPTLTGVTNAESQGMCTRGFNTSKGEESEGEFQVERDQSQLG